MISSIELLSVLPFRIVWLSATLFNLIGVVWKIFTEKVGNY